MAKETRQFLISGRVQGVGFRAFTARMAQKACVKGWVRNLEDGRVEALVEGEQEQLDQLKSYLQDGPSLSQVNSVEEHEVTAPQEFDSFDVTVDGEKPWSKV